MTVHCHSVRKIMLLGFNILVTKSEIRDALEVRSVDVASLKETKISYQTCEVTFG